jgi:nucleotide-binding universal stress UspA family protein
MDSRRALVALDGSTASLEAAARMGEFLNTESLEIDLLCVTDGQQDVELIFAKATTALVRQGLVSRHQITVVGNPADEILRCATGMRADVIVLGARRKTTLEQVLKGSVARKVADRAPCPVLIVTEWHEAMRGEAA